MKNRFVDITGMKFGKWRVVALHPERHRSGRYHCLARWICKCDCGTERAVIGSNLRRGKSLSCGKCIYPRNITHRHTIGGKHTSAYSTWASMLQRCFNPNNDAYIHYGGRGITVCEQWLKFANFLADMGPPPRGKSLDRRNVNGDYERTNCRWASVFEQARNKRPRRR